MADGGTGAGGEKRSTVSVKIRFDDACAGDERRQCAQAMNADNATYQGRMSGAPAWRTEAQGRAERSGRR